ncbi:hypothetical protein ANANG_G00227410 [Anguilla anguilla]|uniref:Uncharacterized protein n=1 Tax=Anguilla anguilla TaxID=7936 RepID=A0A9D3RTA4_ANGAN|nr:hypothetical protein ANANG_G00227410 [Anguilla anguilla]
MADRIAATASTDVSVASGHALAMDDFDYSVQISERDWDLFFQECEECDLLPPAVAGPDDSGTSDADDGASSRSRPVEEGDPPNTTGPSTSPRNARACLWNATSARVAILVPRTFFPAVRRTPTWSP